MKKLSDCRVLLVDDAKTNLDILVEALKREYKLSVAMDGETALKIAAHTPPDLVLLDIVMPNMDGYEVCRRLRAMPETAEVPVIFLSSLDEVQNKTRGFEAGANDYVTKPFETLEVQARARSLLKAKAYSDAAKEQLAADLRVAREIQMGMIPHDFTSLERAFDVEFASALEPAREVGGDLFGAFAVDDGRLALVMGDVSGKGIPASLFMVRTSALVQLLARQIREPERILEALNEELAAENPSGMFVTLACAVFEPGAMRLSIANGGQTQPVLLRPGQEPRWAVPGLGTALGFEPGVKFERVELAIKPGDTIVFYTDGVTEAFDPSSECFGTSRLLKSLAGTDSGNAPSLAKRLLSDVRAFANGAPQSDDIALLLMRVLDNTAKSKRDGRSCNSPKDQEAKSSPGEPALRLNLHATPEEVMRAVAALEVFCEQQCVPGTLIHGLTLALEEIASNIVNHAFMKNADQTWTVSFQRIDDRLYIETRDRGIAFNPLTVPPPKLGPDLDELAYGGIGIYLTRRFVDDLAYTREANENVLRMTKHISTASRSNSR
jgi:sigma-B regulation protein RsbU (phosphoserine phosphatase)